MKTLWFALLLLSWQANGRELCPEPLTLVFSGDWYPYIYLDEQGDYRGEDLTLLRDTLAAMNCELFILPLPERRTRQDLQSGRVDIALSATRTAEREKLFLFSRPYRLQSIVMVHRRDDRTTAALDNLTDLVKQNKLVALNRIAWYGLEVDALLRSAWSRQLMHVETFASRLELLRRGRVDAFIDDKGAVQAEILRSHLQDLTISPRPVDVSEQHFMFSKAKVNQAFVDEFNRQLAGRLQPNYPDP
ncbi:substrate-binding periplasmic protein [Bowmanella dokdonensis]|uniref:Transporter substrate-binding domain-containing protein n=1 Tax=Bowmanella dokdonensis TaxID=751969 RepID=A0A939DL28_9ALTE|nr:transporter substrate-binding domain-containing protein [Bowmanella dokdonensis]MBN7823836.1 transporter substrate-binding domain-containing protein [Bowmanella dokdonensis]